MFPLLYSIQSPNMLYINFTGTLSANAGRWIEEEEYDEGWSSGFQGKDHSKFTLTGWMNEWDAGGLHVTLTNHTTLKRVFWIIIIISLSLFFLLLRSIRAHWCPNKQPERQTERQTACPSILQTWTHKFMALLVSRLEVHCICLLSYQLQTDFCCCNSSPSDRNNFSRLHSKRRGEGERSCNAKKTGLTNSPLLFP